MFCSRPTLEVRRHARNDEQCVGAVHPQEAAACGMEGPHRIKNGVEVVRDWAAASARGKSGVGGTGREPAEPTEVI